MKTRTAKLLWRGFLAFLAVSAVAQAYVVFSSLDTGSMTLGSFSYAIGRAAGLIGFLLLSSLIFIGDTARYWDRYFGLDRIILFNKRFSLASAVFVAFHPIFFAFSGSPGLGYFIPNFSVIPIAIGVIGFYLYAAVMVASALYKRISNTGWQLIHILTYALFFMVLYHAVQGGSDFASYPVKAVYAALLLAVVVGIVYRTRYKLKGIGAGWATVKGLRWDTKDTYTLILAPDRKMGFRPGQFCFLRLDKERLYARHPFTVASPPQSDEMEFTIKLKGRFTKIAADLKNGDKIHLEGPFGIFTLEDDTRDIVMLAGGVGITPFISMIRDQIKGGRSRKILLLYGSRNFEGIIFRQELDGIKDDWFKRVYVLSEDDGQSTVCQRGILDAEAIRRNVKEPLNAAYYICGPEPMKKCVKSALASLGVSKESIFVEDFF